MDLATRVVAEEGKYEFVVLQGKISILRHGEPWIEDFTGAGSKAVMALIFRADELQAEVSRLSAQNGRSIVQTRQNYSGSC